MPRVVKKLLKNKKIWGKNLIFNKSLVYILREDLNHPAALKKDEFSFSH